jgi:aminopeptidase N
LRADLAKAHEQQWRALYARHAASAFEYSPAAKGARRIRNLSLGYIAATKAKDAPVLAFAQFEAADNMTDRLAALGNLANGDADQREAALDIFYHRYRDNALVLDKWFSTQALSARADTLEATQLLLKHPDFTLTNPNRFRALVGAFSVNQRWFHRGDGAGYALLADQIIALDPINPQTAAKMVPPLGRWQRFDELRQSQMRSQLTRIAGTVGLSKDVYEQVTKSLG